MKQLFYKDLTFIVCDLAVNFMNARFKPIKLMNMAKNGMEGNRKKKRKEKQQSGAL